MLFVTETASIRLAQKLTGKGTGDNVAMRFVRKQRGWKLRPDTPGSDDVAFAHEGRTVLVLGPQAAQLLADRILDTRDTPAGPRLQLR
jgi:hypothetical protein